MVLRVFHTPTQKTYINGLRKKICPAASPSFSTCFRAASHVFVHSFEYPCWNKNIVFPRLSYVPSHNTVAFTRSLIFSRKKQSTLNESCFSIRKYEVSSPRFGGDSKRPSLPSFLQNRRHVPFCQIIYAYIRMLPRVYYDDARGILSGTNIIFSGFESWRTSSKFFFLEMNVIGCDSSALEYKFDPSFFA